MKKRRDPYIALMAAAAGGNGLRLSAEECAALSVDGHISTTALSRLRHDERGKEWGQIDPYRYRAHLDAEWRPIPGFEAYQVSSRGHVRRGGRILKPTASSRYGHANVSLYNRPNVRRVGVHQLVAEVFHGAPPIDRPFACHKNGNAWDNRAENIYWGSQAENTADMQAHARFKRRGESVEMTIAGVHYADQSMR